MSLAKAGRMARAKSAYGSGDGCAVGCAVGTAVLVGVGADVGVATLVAGAVGCSVLVAVGTGAIVGIGPDGDAVATRAESWMSHALSAIIRISAQTISFGAFIIQPATSRGTRGRIVVTTSYAIVPSHSATSSALIDSSPCVPISTTGSPRRTWGISVTSIIA